MKYPYKNELVEHYIELFKNEKINSIKEFVDNQKELSPEIVDKYEDFQPIPYHTFYKALRKKPDFDNLKGEKIGNKSFEVNDYNKKKKEKEKDNKNDKEESSESGGDNEMEIKKDIEELDRIKNKEKSSSEKDNEEQNENNQITEKDNDKKTVAGFELNGKNIALGIGLLFLVAGSGYYLYKSYREGGEYVDYEREKEREHESERTGKEGAGEVQDGGDEGYIPAHEL